MTYTDDVHNVFALEVAPSIYQSREDIFELFFLMMVPFCGSDVARTLRGQGRKEKNEAVKPITWADIVQG